MVGKATTESFNNVYFWHKLQEKAIHDVIGVNELVEVIDELLFSGKLLPTQLGLLSWRILRVVFETLQLLLCDHHSTLLVNAHFTHVFNWGFGLFLSEHGVSILLYLLRYLLILHLWLLLLRLVGHGCILVILMRHRSMDCLSDICKHRVELVIHWIPQWLDIVHWLYSTPHKTI